MTGSAASPPGTVLVAGRVVTRGGTLVDVDLDGPRDRVLHSRARIAAAAGVALDGTWLPGGHAA